MLHHNWNPPLILLKPSHRLSADFPYKLNIWSFNEILPRGKRKLGGENCDEDVIAKDWTKVKEKIP